MSKPRQISPILDNMIIGDAISDHNGIRCYPVLHTETNNKYILKIISVPSSATKLEALLLTGALENEEAAKSYFLQRAKELSDEIEVLKQLSRQEGFLPYTDCQIVPMEESIGYEVYILSEYRRTLERYASKNPMTQLQALNLGLDLCSALTACRRSGYLYVNLKPGNIYLSDSGEFRISDLGLISLKTLKYASIAEHYIGAYTAPEITDPFAALNETIDVYAVGMILYEIFNNGILPEKNDKLTPPEYADAELSDIILKACSADPSNRWQDPAQMGQMLVGYIQKNGAHDIPVVPVPPEPEPPAEPEAAIIPEFTDNSNYENISIEDILDIIETTDTTASNEEEPEVESTDILITEVSDAENEPLPDVDMTEGAQGCYATAPDPDEEILVIPEPEDILPEQEISEEETQEVSEEDISEDVSNILSQADALAQIDVPEPVIIMEPENEPDSDTETPSNENDLTISDNEEDANMKTDEYFSEAYLEDEPKAKSHWIRNTIIIVLLLLLIGGGVLFYTLYISKNIEQLQVSGSGDCLTVSVTSDAEESLLSVSCFNTQTQVMITVPVSNGKAEFTGLSPSSQYTITVNISGLHVLSGNTEAEYATPAETTIVQYDVEIGETPGTVKIKFAVNGPDSEKWNFTYYAEGQQPVTESVVGHSFTLKGLKENQKYTGVLEPENNLMIKDPLEISFTASELIRANDLKIVSCYNGSLSCQWSAPESVNVESWYARCYNNNYDQTVNVNNTTATFHNLNSSEGFTIEVWAKGHSVKQTQIVGENSITVHTFSAELDGPGTIDLSWKADTVPQGGWIVTYYTENSDKIFEHSTTSNKAVIAPVAPGCKYTFMVSAADSSITTFCQEQTCIVPTAEENFSLNINQKEITKNDLQVWLCKRPGSSDWSFSDVPEANYTQSFQTNDKAGLIIFLSKKLEKDEIPLDVTIVITDENNGLESIRATTISWNSMWKQNYCTMNLPAIPEEPGCYNVMLYINNMILFETDFYVS